MQPGKDTKQLNKERILRIVYRRKAVSRTDLYRALGVSPATVTLLTDEMIAAGLLVETVAGKSSGGRRPVMLELAARDSRAIVVQPFHSGIRYCVMNLYLDIIDDGIVDFPAPRLVSNLVGCISEVVDSLAGEYGESGDAFVGIGVVIPEEIEEIALTTVVESDFETVAVDLQSALEMRYPCQIYCENAITSKAMAYFDSMERKAGPVLYVEFNRHIEAVMVSGNDAAEQHNWNFDRFAHIVVDQNGRKCACGLRGCLDTLASVEALYLAAREVRGEKRKPAKAAPTPAMLRYLDSAPLPEPLLTTAAKAVCNAINNVLAVVDVERVVVGGMLGKAGWFFPILLEQLPRHLHGIVGFLATGDTPFVPEKGVALALVNRTLANSSGPQSR